MENRSTVAKFHNLFYFFQKDPFLKKRRSVDPVRADECRERLAHLLEKGLKAPLAFNETIVVRHDVMRALFPGLPSDLRTTPYLASEEELKAAGLGSYLKKRLTVTGGGCRVDTPVSIKLFWASALPFVTNKGEKQQPVQWRKFK